MRHTRFTYEQGESIASVGQFLVELKRFAGKGDFRIYFRGQGGPLEALVPSIGRKHYYLGRSVTFDESAERKLLRQFRRHTYEHFGRLATEWETLFLARHHGLPTRLLDWTSNPLVALYFAAFYESEDIVSNREGNEAVREKLHLDGTIWAVQRRDYGAELDVFEQKGSPLRIRGIKFVPPFNPTPRMTAQSGYFTLHGDPWTDMVKCADRVYLARDLDIAKLIHWKVESRHKPEIILELERMAINSRTLFPDLEGLARGLWQTEIIRQCFRGTA